MVYYIIVEDKQRRKEKGDEGDILSVLELPIS